MLVLGFLPFLSLLSNLSMFPFSPLVRLSPRIYYNCSFNTVLSSRIKLKQKEMYVVWNFSCLYAVLVSLLPDQLCPTEL